MNAGGIPVREETVLTGRDNRLHGRLWSVKDDPQGVVIIVHGLGDHGAVSYTHLRAHET